MQWSSIGSALRAPIHRDRAGPHAAADPHPQAPRSTTDRSASLASSPPGTIRCWSRPAGGHGACRRQRCPQSRRNTRWLATCSRRASRRPGYPGRARVIHGAGHRERCARAIDRQDLLPRRRPDRPEGGSARRRSRQAGHPRARPKRSRHRLPRCRPRPGRGDCVWAGAAGAGQTRSGWSGGTSTGGSTAPTSTA